MLHVVAGDVFLQAESEVTARRGDVEGIDVSSIEAFGGESVRYARDDAEQQRGPHREKACRP